MAKINELKAVTREKAGKGAARAERRAKRVPAVIYGDKQPPEIISIAFNEMKQLANSANFMNTLFDIDIDGRKVRVIPRDLQLDVVKDTPLHVDFMRLGKGATVTVEIPVHFINDEECPGIKQGGVLNVVRHGIEVVCPADNIPEYFEIDLIKAEQGDSIHVGALTMPEGVSPTITDRDFTIATIATPAKVKTIEEEEAEAVAAAEAEALAEAEEGGVPEGAEAAKAPADGDKDGGGDNGGNS